MNACLENMMNTKLVYKAADIDDNDSEIEKVIKIRQYILCQEERSAHEVSFSEMIKKKNELELIRQRNGISNVEYNHDY